jgi:hypothetical protein
MLQRQAVALRLHVTARNWVEAYIMYHRMAAYQPAPLAVETYDQIRKLAGIVTAATEAAAFSSDLAILDPVINDTTLSLLPESIQKRLTRDQPTGQDGDRPRAYLRFTDEFPANPKAKDGFFDILNYIEQFV